MRVFLFLFLFVLDVVSKIGALRWIPFWNGGVYPFGGVGVFADFFGISFSLNTIVNTGAAWGIFSGHPGLLFISRAVIICALCIYVFFSKSASIQKMALGFVIVGAIGNSIDYLFYGYVVDFFHFVFWGYSFPIFNLADAYITLGALGLLFLGKAQVKMQSIA